MNYSIKPYIKLDNAIYHNKYDTLITEIMAMPLTELNEAISGMEAVFSGKWQANSFSGQHMAIVDYNKNLATIKYFDELIGEEPTVEIYNMLKAYRDKLVEYEDESR